MGKIIKKIDSKPWCYIAFTVACVGIMIAMALAYNGVVPAYQ